MQKHIMTQREVAERRLIKIAGDKVMPFEPVKHSPLIDRFKNGSYGASSLGFGLYANGHNLRGKSTFAPFGLIYSDGSCVFSVSFFRREYDPKEKPPYMIISSPVGENVEAKVSDFVERVFREIDGLISGAYVRFLKLTSYLKLLKTGFLPVKEHPWHPEAHEEDETYTNGLIRFDSLGREDEGQYLAKYRRKLGQKKRAFESFLRRNDLTYRLDRLDYSGHEIAFGIIEEHFRLLARLGKQIGSTPEDHTNSISKEMLSVPSVSGLLGFIDSVPVSLFVYERLSDKSVGAYTTITLRDAETIIPRLGLSGSIDATGFTALPNYAYVRVFEELSKQGFSEVHLGGSEHPDLNVVKRRIGAVNDPTYWVVKLRESL